MNWNELIWNFTRPPTFPLSGFPSLNFSSSQISTGSCTTPNQRLLRDERSLQHQSQAARRLQGAHPARHRLLRPRPDEQEQAPSVRRERAGRHGRVRRILGHRSRRCPYPACPRWRYPPLWPGCLWQHVPRRFVLAFSGLLELYDKAREDLFVHTNDSNGVLTKSLMVFYTSDIR
jgi:hypothetical protein